MLSTIFLILQGFYFSWAVTNGIDLVDTSEFKGFIMLMLPNALLVVLYGVMERLEA